MAASQLKVDYDQLSTLHQRLQTASDNMRDDSHTMQELASAVGDERLADKIRDFGQDWSVHRADIRENIGWLNDKVKQIADELEKIDGDLAAGLTNSSAPAPTSTNRGPMPI
jgi:predicted  nucleic acid-binding Zn-ribbon protein